MYVHFNKKYLKYYRYHRLCNNDNLVQNNIINLKSDPLYFHKIPIVNHEKVLNIMPRHFFTIDKLEQLNSVTINVKLFKKHFGHIPLYYMKNDHINLITWCPLKLLNTDEWLDCKSIYSILLKETDEDVIINENSININIKSYDIKYINMINYFYLCDI